MSREKLEQFSTIAMNALQVLGACAAMAGFVGFLWLRSEFLPRTEFEEYRTQNQAAMIEQSKAIGGIERTLAVIAEKLLNDTRQDARLEALDNRVREIERGKR